MEGYNLNKEVFLSQDTVEKLTHEVVLAGEGFEIKIQNGHVYNTKPVFEIQSRQYRFTEVFGKEVL